MAEKVVDNYLFFYFEQIHRQASVFLCSIIAYPFFQKIWHHQRLNYFRYHFLFLSRVPTSSLLTLPNHTHFLFIKLSLSIIRSKEIAPAKQRNQIGFNVSFCSFKVAYLWSLALFRLNDPLCTRLYNGPCVVYATACAVCICLWACVCFRRFALCYSFCTIDSVRTVIVKNWM